MYYFKISATLFLGEQGVREEREMVFQKSLIIFEKIKF